MNPHPIRITLVALQLAIVVCASVPIIRANETRVYPPGQRPDDQRLKDPKDLDGYFPFEVPADALAWATRAEKLRVRIQVATGLWPWPERTPLNPVIHGKTQRSGFTVEKVYFESYPNHYVTGLLFRPDDGRTGIRRPAVLCPHGHGGRLQDYGADNMAKLIASGAERFEQSGRFPKLARCAQLARMGCVAFIFDMLGYADSVQITRELAHRYAKPRPEMEDAKDWGLFSAQAEMRLQSIMGIQTWNSVRCLDFLEQLPDVDGSRMAVTGGSGGGTQTILLCAIDPRPIAAFPNGMVSTSMQGGCPCENCSLLRIDSGNVELTALFAPKPQGMTAANDWTKEMMSKGYPQLQQLYEMLGAKENVYCREMLHFPHNYNIVTRETMYSWFNKHLQLGLDEPLRESDWEPLTPGEQSIWNDDHPKPAGGDSYERALTKYLAETSGQQLSRLLHAKTASLAEFQDVVGGAFRSIIGRDVPKPNDIQRTKVDKQQRDGYLYFEDILRLNSRGEEFPIISLYPTDTAWNGTVVVWLDGVGKCGLFRDGEQLHPMVKQLLLGGASVLGVDLFQQGDFVDDGQAVTEQRVVDNPRQVAAYTYCYNDTLLSRRVHDVLTVLAFIVGDEHHTKQVHLVGTAGAAPVAAIARALVGSRIGKAAIDTQGFRFADIRSYRDPNFLPGVVKYGDLAALLALSAPHPLRVIGEPELPLEVTRAYAVGGKTGRVTAKDSLDSVAAWLAAP